MPITTFTARSIATIPAPPVGQVDLWDTSVPGFGIRVSSSGRKTWCVRYRVEGERLLRRLTLKPTYPTLSLADAREQARKALRQAADGIDPGAKKQERRAAGTFRELADEYLKRHAKPGKRSWKKDQRIIRSELLAKDGANWSHVKVRDLTRPMIRTVFETITDRGARVMANRVLALISKMLNFALSRDWIEANPSALIAKNKETSRARVLTDDEVRELWAALGETERIDDHGRSVARLNATLNEAFRMRLCTAQRRPHWRRWSSFVAIPHRQRLSRVHRRPKALAVRGAELRVRDALVQHAPIGLTVVSALPHVALMRGKALSGFALDSVLDYGV